MKPTLFKTLFSYGFYAWLAGLVVLTSIPFTGAAAAQNSGGFRYDYLEHFFLYAMIPVLYNLSRGAGISRIFRSEYSIFILGLLFCALTELHQLLIPGRSFNPIDLGLNLGGYCTAVLAVKLVRNKADQA